MRLFIFLALFAFPLLSPCQSEDSRKPRFAPRVKRVVVERSEWSKFEIAVKRQMSRDSTEGWSYLISGGVALLGGYVGQSVSQDPFEKGAYTLFQTIGVASVGYGAYKWKVGDEDRFIYQVLRRAEALSIEEKSHLIESYKLEMEQKRKTERYIKAITHGLIAGLNFYSASQQSSDSMKNALYFIGGVNLLAALSYTF